jgi:hypothetical protein
MSGRGFLVVALVAVLGTPVYGQWGRGGGGGGGGFRGRRLEGTIETINNNVIKMDTEAGEGPSVLVTITSATKMHYTGKAAADFLRAGQALEFTAEVSEKHTVKDAVTQMTIISLSGKRTAGLFPGESAVPKPAGGNNFGFGPGGGPQAAGAAPTDNADKADKDKKAAAHKGDAVQLPGTCLVRGTIKSFKAGKLMLKIDHGIVKADVSDDAEIKVDTADLSFARVGDSISVRGQGVRGMVAADSVSVQGAEPLTGPKKKSLPAVKKKSPAKKKDDLGDDDDDLKPERKPADKGP